MEEKKEIVGDLEFLDTEPVIKEFVRRPPAGRMDGSKTLKKKRRKRESDKKQWLWLSGFLVIWMLVVICGIALLRTPVLTVILIAFAETALALCLCRSPIWLHGLVIILNIVLGGCFHQLPFLILASLIYIAGVVLMHLVIDRHWQKRKKKK